MTLLMLSVLEYNSITYCNHSPHSSNVFSKENSHTDSPFLQSTTCSKSWQLFKFAADLSLTGFVIPKNLINHRSSPLFIFVVRLEKCVSVCLNMYTFNHIHIILQYLINSTYLMGCFPFFFWRLERLFYWELMRSHLEHLKKFSLGFLLYNFFLYCILCLSKLRCFS